MSFIIKIVQDKVLRNLYVVDGTKVYTNVRRAVCGCFKLTPATLIHNIV